MKNERPIEKLTKEERNGELIRSSFLSSLQKDIVNTKYQMTQCREGSNEWIYLENQLQTYLLIKENYGKRESTDLGGPMQGAGTVIPLRRNR